MSDIDALWFRNRIAGTPAALSSLAMVSNPRHACAGKRAVGYAVGESLLSQADPVLEFDALPAAVFQIVICGVRGDC